MNKLFIVPTPIGNLDDMSLRVISILKNVNYILCENTKVTGKIKNHLNSNARLISLHKFNELSRVAEVKKMLITNDIALVCDAGTPVISDPGQKLINKVKGFAEIVPLPGPVALITALSASGIEFETFSFIGFFEKEEAKILKKINSLINSDIIIGYESPNRINKTLSILLENFGDLNIVIARELTKIYEEIIEDKLSNLLNKKIKGEIVLLIPTKEIVKKENFIEHVEKLFKMNMNSKDIIEYLSSTNKFKKNDIYNYIKGRK